MVKITKSSRDAQVGDYVKIIDASDSAFAEEVTFGKLYEIDRVDGDGDIYFTDDEGDENIVIVDEDEFEVYELADAVQVGDKIKDVHFGVGYVTAIRPVGFICATDGLTFVTEDGHGFWTYIKDVEIIGKRIEGGAKVGDKVLIVDASDSGHDGYDNGEIHTVTETDLWGNKGEVFIDVKGAPYVKRDEFVIVERPVEKSPKLNVGDYVKTLTNSRFGSVKKGEVGVVVGMDFLDGSYIVEPLRDRNVDGLFTKGELEVVDDPTPEPTPAHTFKVGDTVRLNVTSESPKHGWGNVSNGEIGTVATVNFGDVIVDFPSHESWYGVPSELELSTGFNVGDIVRIKKYEEGFVEGSLVEVVGKFGNESVSVKGVKRDVISSNFVASKQHIELVTPASARVDQ